MIKKIIAFPFIFFALCSFAQTDFPQGHNKYMVFFKDKKNTTFNPHEYFDTKAIERRLNQGLPLSDSSDFPVNVEYIKTVSSLADSISYSSRWFNSLTVFADENSLQKITDLPFVKSVEQLSAQLIPAGNDKGEYNITLNKDQLKLLQKQTERLGISSFREKGFDGKGIRIAIFDAGFPSVDVNPCFEHIRKENRIIKTFDFGKNRENVYAFNGHGTNVFSCIAGMVDSLPIGLATGAEFLLARTENALYEPYGEEENWLAAVEWADKNGADIINSSLGYTVHRYFREDMNGKISLISRAANMAAGKGILVVNAAGNEGESGWKFIGTPADADSVLSIGGIDPETDIHSSFSSFGPTADKRLKPNVSAYGSVIAAGKFGLVYTQGTSFASPLVAGFAACAWQSNRNLSNMELFREIEKSATLFPYYDYAHGYGIPQAEYFINGKNNTVPTFDIVTEGKLITVTLTDSAFNGNSSDKFYYHILNEEGSIDEYFVLKVTDKIVLELDSYQYDSGKKLVLFYKGYFQEFLF
ncbi:MAG: S8 family serine peptidase [Bacteroidia bacterium]